MFQSFTFLELIQLIQVRISCDSSIQTHLYSFHHFEILMARTDQEMIDIFCCSTSTFVVGVWFDEGDVRNVVVVII